VYVLLLHFNQSIDGYNFINLAPFIAHGHTGVDIFFYLSGYILTYVYWSNLKAFDWAKTRDFLVLRLARIYPAHIVALAIVVALYVVASGGFNYQFNFPENWIPSHLVFSATLTHAWGASDIALWNAPSWSISSEWLAYIIYPFIFPIVVYLGRGFWVFGCLALLAAIWWVYGIQGEDLATTFQGPFVIFRIMSEFWIGSMLFLLVRNLRPHIAYDGLAVGILLVFLASGNLGLTDYQLVVIAPLLILALHKCNGPVSRVMSYNALLFLGRVSYSAYIIHFPVNMILKYAYGLLGLRDMGFAVNSAWYLGLILVTIFCGWVLYVVVEEPARTAVKSRWSNRLKRKSVSESA